METGSFITRDPLGFVDGPNVYTYVNDNPWTHFDPVGLLSNDENEHDYSLDNKKPIGVSMDTVTEKVSPSGSAKVTLSKQTSLTQLDDNKSSNANFTSNEFRGPPDFNISNGNDDTQNWNRDIHGTVFGGSSEKPSDHERSAYTGKLITDLTLGASLPAGGLNGKYIEIRNQENGETAGPVPITDKGPHFNGTPNYPSDPYYQTNSRPLAETEPLKDKNGKIVYDKHGNPRLKYPNQSGLDSTPAIFNKLHVPWKAGYTDSKGKEHDGAGDGMFDWRFVPKP